MPFSTRHADTQSFQAGLGYPIRSVAAAATLTSADHVVHVDTSAAAVTITLPPAASAHDGVSGSVYRIVCLSASDDVTVDGAGAETIDGATTSVISGAYAGLAIQSTGTAWVSLP